MEEVLKRLKAKRNAVEGRSLQGLNILSKEAQKKIAGGGCGVVHRFNGGASCIEYTGSKKEAIDGTNQLHQDIQSGNGEGNWYSADSAGWCCASCGKMAQCSNDIYF